MRKVYIKSNLPLDNNIDCHGLSCDDAVRAVDKVLDLYYLYDKKRLNIIHGIGEQKLKQAIREYLDKSPYVLSYKDGGMFEDDPAVTLVELVNVGLPNYDS